MRNHSRRRSLALLVSLVLLLTGCALHKHLAQAEEAAYIDESAQELMIVDSAEDEALRESLRLAAGMRHILLLGVDSRPGESTGRSDAMMIVTLDPEGGEIKLTSLMRDLYVEIPGRKNNRLNAAYAFGGAELLADTIEANFGLRIENYVAVDFSALAALIDQLGGIEADIADENIRDRVNAVIREDNRTLGISPEDGLLEKAGLQRLTGRQAQAYARFRHGTGDGDFGRTARQREVIGKIFDRLSGMNALELSALAVANLDKVRTNLGLDDILALIPALLDMKDARVSELRIPVAGGYRDATIDGMAVLVPDRTENKRAIGEFLTD